MKRSVEINGDTRLFAKTTFLKGGGGDIDGCGIFKWIMKGGGGKRANLSAIWPEVTFGINNNGFALLNASSDGGSKIFHGMKLVGDGQCTCQR